MPKRKLRTYFITGLLVLLPIMLTIIALEFFFSIIAKIIRGLFPFLPNLPFNLEIISTFTGLILFTLFVGFLVHNHLKNRLEIFLDNIFTRIPVIRSLYIGTKKVTEAMLSDNEKRAFKRVVFVPFPSKKVYTLGFVTHESIKQREDYAMVFIPQAPLPNNGYVMMVKKTELIDASMSVNEAVKLIFSGGILESEEAPKKTNKK
ncbi:DUF502 domain-containing protein [Candidatus Woesearchaeota archaeon]|nr:DUF502 domain-containing protein [Candidatus Woesearchaeota archaeon]